MAYLLDFVHFTRFKDVSHDHQKPLLHQHQALTRGLSLFPARHAILLQISTTYGKDMAGKSSCTQAHVDKGMEYIQGGYEEKGESVPTSQGLALYMDVARATPYNWAEQESCKFREEMAYIIDRVQAIQAVKIINGGLTGTYNPAFAGKLVGNHGFSDRQELDHKSSDGSMSPKGKTLDDFYNDVPAKP